MSAPWLETTVFASVPAVMRSVGTVCLVMHQPAASKKASLAGEGSSWLTGRGLPLLASPPPPPISPRKAWGIRSDATLGTDCWRAWQLSPTLSDYYGHIYRKIFFFTLVQGQTPVTPPTLANTKENWMEEGTDHVICMDKCRFLIRRTWRRLVIDTFEADVLSFPRFFECSVLYYANLTITAAVWREFWMNWTPPRFCEWYSPAARPRSLKLLILALKWAFINLYPINDMAFRWFITTFDNR